MEQENEKIELTEKKQKSGIGCMSVMSVVFLFIGVAPTSMMIRQGFDIVWLIFAIIGYLGLGLFVTLAVLMIKKKM